MLLNLFGLCLLLVDKLGVFAFLGSKHGLNYVTRLSY
jgi:hypothetical protein